jgi:hypothetical protein
MSFVYPVQIINKNSGLCNQIQSLLGGLTYALNNNIQILFIEKFLCDYNNENSKTSFSEIFDTKKMNESLNKEYGIYIFDSIKINLRLLSIIIDGKEVLYKYINDFVKDSLFCISKNYLFNEYINDIHNICIKIEINEQKFDLFTNIKNGKIEKEICIELNYDKINFYEGDIWTTTNHNNFINFINHIHFTQEFYKNTNIWLTNNQLNNNIFNTIHLRVEDDAINHWSVNNNMKPEVFKKELIKKNIYLIKKYFNKDIPIVILSYDTNNEVIDYLVNNNYKILYRNKKKEEGREINAIYDLILGKKTSGIYIGPISSSFTQIIFFSNINNIDKNDFVFYFINKIDKDEIIR